MNIHFIYTIFSYHNFIIPSIPFSGGVPIPCDTSLQLGSSYIWVFQIREVFTRSLEILLLNHDAYSVDQYENLKNMKNTFHQIHFLLFKILFGKRLKNIAVFHPLFFQIFYIVLVYLWVSCFISKRLNQILKKSLTYRARVFIW